MRLRIASLVVVAIVITGVLTAVQFPFLVAWFQRNLSQGWVLGSLIAVVIFLLVPKSFWEYRKFLRFWALLAGFIVLHFLIAVPILGRLGTIRAGRVEEIYMDLLALV